jgi:hypothetical protein
VIRFRPLDHGGRIAPLGEGADVAEPVEVDQDVGQDAAGLVESAPVGKRRVRRRRVPGGRRHKYSVRFTAAENTLLESAAAAAGLTVPNLVAETVMASLTGPVVRQMPMGVRRALGEELAKVRGFLAAIGTNVNQLAATANTFGGVPTKAETAVESTMHAVAARMRDLDEALALLRGERLHGEWPAGERRR